MTCKNMGGGGGAWGTFGRRNGRVNKVSRLLATYLFHTGSRPARDDLKINLSECMWFDCRLPIAFVSQAYPGNAEI